MTQDDSYQICLQAIQTAPWFKYMAAEGHEFLARHAQLRDARRGGQLIIRGEANDHVFGIVKGRAIVGLTTAEGLEYNLNYFLPGHWFGDYTLDGETQAPLDVTLLEPSQLVAIPCKDLIAAGEQWPALYRGMHSDLAHRTYGVYGLLELAAAHPLPIRLAVWLVLLCDHIGVESDTGMGLSYRVTQTELASFAGGSRQSVNQILRDWVADGLIAMQGRDLEIRDLDRLRKMITAEEG